MVQLDQYTMTEPPCVSGFEEPGNFDRNATRHPLARNLDDAFLLGVAHEADARTMGVVDIGEGAATRPTSAGRQQQNDDFASVLDFPPQEPWSARTFHALQEWEGYVVAIRDEDFVVRLIDLTSGSTNEEEEADIPLAEISGQDSATIRPGSVFRWVIGYERSAAGTKRRVSEIVFRDVPEITETDLRDSAAWAHEAVRSLNL
ncbi:MAG: hypothetical protein OXH83_12270 [Bryobacterales bacterium]|nr:hypothetical protein [Bryobacterales bacterium]